jgi:hypothetical protein
MSDNFDQRPPDERRSIVSYDSDDMEIMDAKSLSVLTGQEMLHQVEIARRFPRDLTKARATLKSLATETEEIAEECIYALPRGNKTIEGPSARFAEMMAFAWTNCRAASRVVAELEQVIVAQGVFHDMETNCFRLAETRRSIIDSKGRRYNLDMIVMTGNAAGSIALRNATTRGIPKPHWLPAYLAARAVIVGDSRSLSVRREKALHRLQLMGAQPDEIVKLLDLKSAAEITGEHLIRLRGLIQAVQDGDTTIDLVFGPMRKAAGPAKTDVAQVLREGKANGETNVHEENQTTKKRAAKKTAAAVDGQQGERSSERGSQDANSDEQRQSVSSDSQNGIGTADPPNKPTDEVEASAPDLTEDERVLLADLRQELAATGSEKDIQAAWNTFEEAFAHMPAHVQKMAAERLAAARQRITKPADKKATGGEAISKL